MRVAVTRSSSKAGSGVPGTSFGICGPTSALIALRSFARSRLVGWRKAAHEFVRQQLAAGLIVESAPHDADQPGHPGRPDQPVEHAVGLVLDRCLIERAGRI